MKVLTKKAMVGLGLLLSVSQIATASLLVDVMGYYHPLPESVNKVCQQQENCPEIEIEYIQSSQRWVNRIINQKVDASIDDTIRHKPITINDYEVTVSKAVKIALDDFAKSQIEEESVVAYSLSVSPTYLGHVGSLELFEVGDYLYTGGAHGMGHSEYVILDQNSKRQLKLDDLLIKGKKAQLNRLVEKHFDKWLMDNELDVAEHKATWEYKMTDNVTFGKKGLTFLYQPYEIGFYAMGMPEVIVPYHELKGVIKSTYLRPALQMAR